MSFTKEGLIHSSLSFRRRPESRKTSMLDPGMRQGDDLFRISQSRYAVKIDPHSHTCKKEFNAVRGISGDRQ